MVRARSVDDLSLVWSIGQDAISPMPAKREVSSGKSLPASTFVASSFRIDNYDFERPPDVNKANNKNKKANRKLSQNIVRGKANSVRTRWRTFGNHSEVHEIQPYDPVRSVAFTDDEMFLLVGLQSGTVWVYTPDNQYIKNRLNVRLAGYGFG